MKSFFGIVMMVATVAQLSAMTPKEAVLQLERGNARYVAEKYSKGESNARVRKELAEGQKPFAIILGCSDSRVPPEIIFDQGLGDLFTVRVAGQVLDPVILDSIEYSIIHLGSVLIVVLGHENCGAVEAVMQGKTQDIETVANRIQPAIAGATTVEQAVKQNINFVYNQLKAKPVVFRYMQKGQVGVVGAYYELKSGKVQMLFPLDSCSPQ